MWNTIINFNSSFSVLGIKHRPLSMTNLHSITPPLAHTHHSKFYLNILWDIPSWVQQPDTVRLHLFCSVFPVEGLLFDLSVMLICNYVTYLHSSIVNSTRAHSLSLPLYSSLLNILMSQSPAAVNTFGFCFFVFFPQNSISLGTPCKSMSRWVI